MLNRNKTLFLQTMRFATTHSPMKSIRKLMQPLALLVMALTSSLSQAQILEPVEWSFSHERISEGQYELQLTANMDAGWYIYGTELEPGGPIPTSINFDEGEGFELLGPLRYPAAEVKYDPNFEMDIPMFADRVTFRQTVRVLSAE